MSATTKTKKVVALKGLKLSENRILIKQFAEGDKTPGGIIMPGAVIEGGVIVAKGPEVKGYKMLTKVRYLKHGKIEEIDGVEYYLIRETDIWTELVAK